jgi:hypothetical protein
MKRLVIIAFCLSLIIKISAQERELLLNISYSNSSLVEFNNSIGIETGFMNNTKNGNKFGVRVSCHYNPFNYDYIKKTLAGPDSYIIREVKPNSFALVLQTDYSFPVYTNDNSAIYLGPLVGVNTFIINELVHSIPTDTDPARDFTNKSFSGPKFSIGCLLSHEIHNVFSENLGLTYSISSRIGNYEELFAMGSNDPWFYLSFEFKVGLNIKTVMRNK